MRQTNKKIYDELYRCVQRGVDEVVKREYPNGLPKEFYQVVPAGSVVTYEITGAIIYTGFYENEKPTKKDIEAINNLRLCFPSYSKADIYLHYKYTYGDNNAYASGSQKETDFLKYGFILDHEQALAKAKEITDLRTHEDQLLSNGDYVRCEKCRKVVLKTQSIKHNIIGRGRKQTWNSWKNRYEDKACVTTTLMTFCSGQCAGNEQMSREG
jgi:radical SAM protein with 4Fe4S-binding SPASM domain